jgi:putative hydrolase of the HAD superfamily
MELDAAIFDFGGVLTTSIRASFAAFEAALGLPEAALLEAFRHHADDEDEPSYALLEKGLMTEGEFYASMFKRVQDYTGMELNVPTDPAEVRAMMFGSLRRNEEMIAVAAAIGQHYRTAILSNNVKEWTGWREMVDAHIFDLVIDSSEVGMRKPEPEIYTLTCSKLGVKPERSAFVDDIAHNVEGARAVGMHAIQFTTTEEVLDALKPLFPKAFEAREKITHA